LFARILHSLSAFGNVAGCGIFKKTGLATLPNPFFEQWTSGNLVKSAEKSGLTILSKYLLQPFGNATKRLPPAGGIEARGFPLQVAF